MQCEESQSNRADGEEGAYTLSGIRLTPSSASTAFDRRASGGIHRDMDEQPNNRVEEPAQVGSGTRWRERLDRLRKNKAVRMHVRCWLLGLVSFGPIR